MDNCKKEILTEEDREAALNILQEELNKVIDKKESDYLPIMDEMDRIMALVLGGQ